MSLFVRSMWHHWKAHRAGLVLQGHERGWQAVREWIGVAIVQYAWDRMEVALPYRRVVRVANWILP